MELYPVYLSAFIGIWYGVTSAILLRNLAHFHPLPRVSGPVTGRISVCIPARNEETGIAACVLSYLDQDHPDYEILVLDDGSTDRTGAILAEISHPRLRVLHGTDPEPGWLGKPRACMRLAEQATGDILLFADADTWVGPDTLGRTAAAFAGTGADLVSVWPWQQLGSRRERWVIPAVYHALLTLLPIVYAHRPPRWMPRFLRARLGPLFAAANGQFLAIRRDRYFRIGGHAAVRDRVVDDVELARAVRADGGRIRLFNGIGTVACRMYRSDEDLWNGFRKNFLAGFGYNVPLFIGMGLVHATVVFGPWLLLPWHPVAAALLLLAPVAQRLLVAALMGFPLRDAPLHVVSVLWFQRLAFTVLRDHLTRRPVSWKGRYIPS